MNKSTLAAAILVLTLAACRPDGVPKAARSYGGGQTISFTAPTDGVAYVAEYRAGILMTRTLRKGESLELKGQVPISDTETRRLTGDTRLYFEPLVLPSTSRP